MSDKYSVIGFTEAELGLFVAILIFIIAAAGPRSDVSSTGKSQSTPSATSMPNLESLSRQIEALTKENRRLQARLALLEAEAQKTSALRSRQLPSCKEKRLTKGFLFDVVITGPESFQVGSRKYDFDALIDNFDSQISSAKAAGCVHTIRVFYVPGVSLSDYLGSLDELRQYFYPSDSGALQ